MKSLLNRQQRAIDFVARRYWSFGLSLAIFLLALGSVMGRGLNLGIDFTGGIVIEAERSTPIDVAELRQRLSGGQFGEVVIQQLDKPTDVLIRVQGNETAAVAQNFLVDGIKAALGPEYTYRDIEVLGAQVGGELLRNGLIAALLATLGISIYVAIRFE